MSVTMSGKFWVAAINPYSILAILNHRYEDRSGRTHNVETRVSIQTTATMTQILREKDWHGNEIVVTNASVNGVVEGDDGRTYLEIYTPEVELGRVSRRNQEASLARKFKVTKDGDGYRANETPAEEILEKLAKLLKISHG